MKRLGGGRNVGNLCEDLKDVSIMTTTEDILRVRQSTRGLSIHVVRRVGGDLNPSKSGVDFSVARSCKFR